MRLLAEGHEFVSLADALDALDVGDGRPTVVLTFDDGFADVLEPALTVFAEHGLPFTMSLATDYLGREMHWDGSTASAPGPALSWDEVETLVASGLCTIGNHTHGHVRPEVGTEVDVDECTEAISCSTWCRAATPTRGDHDAGDVAGAARPLPLGHHRRAGLQPPERRSAPVAAGTGCGAATPSSSSPPSSRVGSARNAPTVRS